MKVDEFDDQATWRDSFSRQALWGASLLGEPICWVSEKCHRLIMPIRQPAVFDAYENPVAEVAYRVALVGALALGMVSCVLPAVCLASGILHKILRGVGLLLQKKGTTYIPLSAARQELGDTFQVTSWNVSGIAGGMQYSRSGVVPWPKRCEQIAKAILAEDSDVVCLQEIYDARFLKELIGHLGKRYAHTWMSGQNWMGSSGGTVIFSKIKPTAFESIPFKNNDWTLNRTFEVLQFGRDLRVIGTHLIHDSPKRRKEQMEQILAYIQESGDDVPTILVGDLNMEPEGEGDPFFPKEFQDVLEAGPTCSNCLERQWENSPPALEESKLDYIAVRHFGPWKVEKTSATPCDAGGDTRLALTDHKRVTMLCTKAPKSADEGKVNPQV